MRNKFQQSLHACVMFFVDNRWLTIFGVLLISGLFAYGITKLQFHVSYKSLMGPSSELFQATVATEEEYFEDISSLTLFTPKSGDVFQREVLQAIADFTELAWRTPGVKRVDSLTNFQYSEVDEDGMTLRDLVEYPEELSLEDLAAIREAAMNERRLKGFLLAADGQATAVSIDYRIDSNDPFVVVEAVDHLQEIITEINAAYPNVEVNTVGYVPMLNAWLVAIATDFQTIIPIAVFSMIFALWWFFRSLAATAATFGLAILSIMVGVGTISHLGQYLLPMTATGTIMIMILAIADAVHIVMTMVKLQETGLQKNEAIVKSVELNFNAVAVTSITTAIGFLSFNFTEFRGLQIMGNMVAAGVIAALFLSVVFLPAVLTLCDVKPRKGRSNKDELIANSFYSKLADIVIKYRWWLLIATGPAVLANIYVAQQNIIDDNLNKSLSKSDPFRLNIAIVEERLTGSSSLMYNLKSTSPSGVADPEFIKLVDDFATWYRQQDTVRFVRSYTDTLRQLNQDLHGGDPDFYALPTDPELAAQYLLLYELSLPEGLDLTNQINVDKTGTLLMVTIDEGSAPYQLELAAKASAWLAERAPEQDSRAMGAAGLMNVLLMKTIESMIYGGLLALLIIGVVLVVAMRSVYASVLAVITIIAPILSAFAVWALINGEVGLACSLTIGVIVGISVDNAVHFLTKFLYAYRELLYTPEDAVRYSFVNVGGAITVNSLAIGASFFLLSFCNMKFFGDIGLLTSITIVFAVVACFLLLPVLILLVYRQPAAAGEKNLGTHKAK